MSIHYISQTRLRTGNDKLDDKIHYLLSMVSGKVENFLNEKQYISCDKVENFIGENFIGDENTQKTIINTLTTVRKKLSFFLHLELSLKRFSTLMECEIFLSQYHPTPKLSSNIIQIMIQNCQNLKQAEYVLDKYTHGVTLDVFVINTLIKLSKNIQDCQQILEKYSNNIPHNNTTYNILLKKLFEDKMLNISQKHKILKILLTEINQIGFPQKIDKEIFHSIIKHHSGDLKPMIVGCIEQYSLSNLAE